MIGAILLKEASAEFIVDFADDFEWECFLWQSKTVAKDSSKLINPQAYTIYNDRRAC